MFKPRIIFGPPLRFREIRIELSAHEWRASPEYDLLVNAAWQEMRSQHSLWDGVYYRLMDPAEPWRDCPMRLGLIRYRYIATYRELQEQHARSGLDALHHLSTIALIRTSDGYYLFGRRARDRAIELIGGGVQQDELAVSTGADLERNLYKEIREETGIAPNHIEELSGRGALLSSTSNVLLLAHARLRIPKTEVQAIFDRRTDNEMAEHIFVAEEDLRSFLPALPDYRALIPSLL
jgi:8-oxo-dGTP pyrophosphatase MutT (NUDIX family)